MSRNKALHFGIIIAMDATGASKFLIGNNTMAGQAGKWGLGLLPWFMAACFVPVLAVLTVQRQKLN